MPSHQKLKEDEELAGEKPQIVVKKKRCNFWLWVANSQVIVFIFLILAICGVFDSVSDDSNESSAAGLMENVVLNGESSIGEKEDEEKDNAQERDSYMTGDTAPNIIFLLANDIGYADISHHNGEFSTPNIDALLESGVEFTRFYSHHSSTPSRMALLTGRLAWKLGSQFPEELQGMMTGHIPFAEKTFAEVTKEMGYNNYYVGQWGAGYATWSMTPLGRGWDKFMGYFGSKNGYYTHTTDHFEEWLDVYDLWENQELFVDNNMTYSEDLFLQKSLLYLEEAKESGKPFTFTYASQTAHSPIDDDYPSNYPPMIWMECNQDNARLAGREYFCNKVKYLDYTWGILIDHLKTHDMWDNTIIFLASDNGALPFTENLDSSDWGSNWPLRGGKYSNFEGGIKVWAGMSGGLVPENIRGTTFEGLTHIVDFGATAMRLSMTSNQFGERTSLTGTEKNVDGKNLYYFEEHDLIVHTIPTQFLPTWMTANCSNWAATDGHWKYIVGSQCGLYDSGWHNFPGQESILMSSDPVSFNAGGGYCIDGCLFDLSIDQNEYLDVSKDYPTIAEYFRELTDAIYIGGFDEEYHSGQPADEDYRGYQKDNILRPYINEAAIADYVGRMETVDYNYTYDYYTSPQLWIGDYDGLNSPFGSDDDE